MKFVKILPIHYETCKKIIEAEGNCLQVSCSNCPFTWFNSPNRKHCNQNGYSNTTGGQKDMKKVKSCDEFLNGCLYLITGKVVTIRGEVHHYFNKQVRSNDFIKEYNSIIESIEKEEVHNKELYQMIIDNIVNLSRI